MKKILIGTTNPSKVRKFQELLEGYDVEFMTLTDIGVTAEPSETGRSPRENAEIKARFYGQFADYVICSDSGLYWDEIPAEDSRQPGLKIRSPYGKRLNDDEMIDYYTKVIHELGGRVLAYYLDGAAVSCKGKVSSVEEDRTLAKTDAFYMVDQVNDIRHPGWPLDSISIDAKQALYFVDETYNRDETVRDQIEKNRLTKDFLVKALELEVLQ